MTNQLRHIWRAVIVLLALSLQCPAARAQCTTVTSFHATDNGCSAIVVSWTVSPAPGPYVGVRLLRGTTPDVRHASLRRVSPLNPFVDDQVSPGTTYFYWVKYGTTTDYGALIECASAGPEAGLRVGPDAPTAATATYGTVCGAVRVDWVGSPYANRYEIWRNTVNNSASAGRIAYSAAPPFEDHDSAIVGIPVYYFVRAVNEYASCASGFSGPGALGFRGPVTGPSGLSASNGEYCRRVYLAWPSVPGSSGYEVWRATTATMADTVRVGEGPAASYDDVSGTPGQVYYYAVRAVNACGFGPFTPSSAPGSRSQASPTPAGLQASDGTTCAGVQVTWTPVADHTEIDQYQIFRSLQPNESTATLIGTSIDPSYLDGSAAGSTLYYYWVRSNGLCGPSPLSAGDAGWRRVGQPTVLLQPSPVALAEGATAVFHVAASGFGATTYQWFKDGAAVVDGGRFAGATSPNLAISAVLPIDAGSYRVRITDTCGSVFSTSARLGLTSQRLYDNTVTQVFNDTFTSSELEIGDLVTLAPAGLRFEISTVEMMFGKQGPFSGDLTLRLYDGPPANGAIPLASVTILAPSLSGGNLTPITFTLPPGTVVPSHVTLAVVSTSWNRLKTEWGDPPVVGSSDNQVFYARTASGWQPRTFSGTGRPANIYAKIVGHPVSCQADFNGSGSSTVQDVFAFLSAWFAGEARADFNGVGGVTVQDIFDFLSRWFAGC